MAYPLTSIIILTKNNVQFTERCLLSIYSHSEFRNTPYEIIVLDENSIDGTKELCELHRNKVRYINAPTYNSFSSRNNYGASLAKGQYLWFLNNDVEILNNNLVLMLRHFENPNIAVVGSMHLFPDMRLNHIGMAFDNTLSPQHIYPNENPNLSYIKHGRFIDLVTAASIVVDKDKFNNVGGFNEEYKWGYEDVDFMLKVKEAGYLTYCDSDALMIHFGQSTYGRNDNEDQNKKIFMQTWSAKIKPNLDKIYEEKEKYLMDQKSLVNKVKHETKKLAKEILNTLKKQKQINIPPTSNIYIFKSPKFTSFSNIADQLERSIYAPHVVINSIAELYNIKDVPSEGALLISTSHFDEDYMLPAPQWIRDYRSFDINYEKSNYSHSDYWVNSLKYSNTILLPSSEYCRDFLIKSAIPEERVFIVPHGFNPAMLNHDFISSKENKTPSEKINILAIINTNDEGRYGTERLSEALYFLRKNNPDIAERIHLIIKNYGGKPTEVYFKTKEYKILKENNIEIEYISSFLSEDDLAKLYYRSDLFIAPFHGEGFGMKILDAAVAGLPIIAPNYGGPKDFLKFSEHIPVKYNLVPVTYSIDYSLLVEDETFLWADVDSEDLSKQIKYSIDNIKNLKEQALSKRTKIREEFSYQAIWKKIKEIDNNIKNNLSNKQKENSVEIIKDLTTSTYKKLDNIEQTLLINEKNISNHLFQSLTHLKNTFNLKEELKGEILVVDDGSGEDPQDILKQFDDLPLRFIQYKKWAGPGISKQIGIDNAKGDHIIIIGDDIKPMPGFFKRHYQFNLTHPEPYILMGHVEWDTTIRNSPVADFSTKITAFQFSFEEKRNQKEVDFLVTPNLSFRKSDIIKTGVKFKKLIFYEDLVWGKELITNNFKIYYDRAACALHNHQINTTWLTWLINRSASVGEYSVLTYMLFPLLKELHEIKKYINMLTHFYGNINDIEFDIYSKAFDIEQERLSKEYKNLETLDNDSGYDTNLRKYIYKKLGEVYILNHAFGIAKALNSNEKIAKSLAFLYFNNWTQNSNNSDNHSGIIGSLKWFIYNGRLRFPKIFNPILKIFKFAKRVS